jgi:endonuclease/exonuclease/phosphatase family metal-dependent hydrolase
MTPIERIDLIFAAGPTALSVALTGTTAGEQGIFASDHVGVVADFALDNHRPNVPNRKK